MEFIYDNCGLYLRVYYRSAISKDKRGGEIMLFTRDTIIFLIFFGMIFYAIWRFYLKDKALSDD